MLNGTNALAAEAVAFYQEHGWLVTPDVLDYGALDDEMFGLEQHWAGHRDHALPGAGKHCADWMPGDGDGTRNNEYISLQNNLVSRLAWSPANRRDRCVCCRQFGGPSI